MNKGSWENNPNNAAELAKVSNEMVKLLNHFDHLNRYRSLPKLNIRKVLFKKPATVIFWSDDTKTVVKCAESDTYNELLGFFICVMTKVLGKKTVHGLYDIFKAELENTENKTV